MLNPDSASKPGRPSSHSPELAAEICRRLADGESLRAICAAPDMPNRSTVHLWVVEDREGFSNQYANARRAQALRWADEILDIADDGVNDTYTDEDGRPRVDHDVIQRSRLRVDTRKWLLSKVLPKVYGDRQTIEHSGPDGGPIETRDVPDEELMERAAQLRNRLAAVMPATPNGNGKH